MLKEELMIEENNSILSQIYGNKNYNLENGTKMVINIGRK